MLTDTAIDNDKDSIWHICNHMLKPLRRCGQAKQKQCLYIYRYIFTMRIN